MLHARAGVAYSGLKIQPAASGMSNERKLFIF